MKLKYLFHILPIILLLFYLISNTYAEIIYKDYPILSKKRLELTGEYVKKHYGLDDVKIIGLCMIVVHYTATSAIPETLNLFKPDELDNSRKEIILGGRLNVGVHYVIDTNGDIWSLLPPDIIGRHTIGFNHVSLGIEMVASDADKITYAQLESCTELVYKLSSKYNSIKYLIGHYEYMQKDLPHYSLFKELDKSYKFTKKLDPGREFMNQLRTSLKNKYKIKLLP